MVEDSREEKTLQKNHLENQNQKARAGHLRLIRPRAVPFVKRMTQPITVQDNRDHSRNRISLTEKERRDHLQNPGEDLTETENQDFHQVQNDRVEAHLRSRISHSKEEAKTHRNQGVGHTVTREVHFPKTRENAEILENPINHLPENPKIHPNQTGSHHMVTGEALSPKTKERTMALKSLGKDLTEKMKARPNLEA